MSQCFSIAQQKELSTQNSKLLEYINPMILFLLLLLLQITTNLVVKTTTQIYYLTILEGRSMKWVSLC